MEDSESLYLYFLASSQFKSSYIKTPVTDYVVNRSQPKDLHQLYEHIQRSLKEGSSCFSLFPIAVYVAPSRGEKSIGDENKRCFPLVSDEIWRKFVSSCRVNRVKVYLEMRPTYDLPKPSSSCFPFRNKELKSLDVASYFPSVLERDNLKELSSLIFDEDFYVKDNLRRGVWMHLLEVFPPELKTLSDREKYMNTLRRIYDIMKGKLFSERDSWTPEKRHLYDSIHRDAVRTDPTEEFISEEFIEKLVSIVMIYTLEHYGVVKYTQGMTDLLSPLLYVMEREDDAYICFAAMFKRIHENFGEWCDGALNKLERLRHLCEVLDPQLYRHLCDSGTGDDPFILFFGMLLIECRREFSFDETLHLLEVMWCAAFPRQKETHVPQFEWACFMTNVSAELVKEVFTSTCNPPYSAERLQSLSLTLPPVSSSHCHSIATTPSSMPVDIPYQNSLSNECHSNDEREPKLRGRLSSELSPGRDRASSLPDSKEYLVIDAKDAPPLQSTKSEGDIPTDEEEKNDIVSDLESSLAHTVNKKLKGNNEMSDLSSVSSINTASSNGVARQANNDGAFPSPRLTRNNGAALPQASHVEGPGTEEDKSTTVIAEGEDVNERSLEIPKCVSDTALRDYEDTQFDISTRVNDDRSLTPPVKSKEDGAKKKYHTLPRERQRFEDSETGTYGRESHSLRASSPSHYLIHQLVSGTSSPYVSGINPRGLRRDRNRGELLESSVLPQNSGSGGESRRLFTIKRGGDSPYLSRSRSGSSVAPHTPTSGIFEPEIFAENRGERAGLVAADENVVSSQLVSSERARPDINLESSLKYKMSDSFSLFVCLSILLSHREALLSRPVDFVTLSLILSSDSINSMFKPILRTSHQLYACYRKYLELSKYTRSSGSSDDKWLDDFGELPEEAAMPPDSPLRISPATSCSINNYDS
ncbi:PREDICTED: uncharacterized protein LOC109582251 [Amphimedon queenslandica]|uniref:Rab-GAP TBC domain-containing protein n=1 Tax=Amphimedon queenslandica TaxID=400682 RepID=A0A1X7UTA3_AMPQE|nr:PREDICTED: uncharacterized protein LOC109582251 [Amphimedon queenslandica]|eukprot:XP_019852463.1 PREDICTED: uncharacterized protein LOC109582251 [Amphimedon queenslandica]